MNIVIVGGGFAGVRAALELDRLKVGTVTLISDESYFLHHATLYATATGRSRAESVIRLDEIFASTNVRVIRDKMTSIDHTRKLVQGENGQYSYGKLVLAIGSVTTYFDIKGVAEHAFGIKSLSEIDSFSRHLKDEVAGHHQLDKHYYIIGCGPTGVELAGALQGYLLHLKDIYKNTKGKISIVLVEAADRVMPRGSKTASRVIKKRLTDLGISVQTSHTVGGLDDETITINGKKITTETAVWTSGVANNSFFSSYGDLFHIAPNGRINTDAYLEAADDIYVLGDNNTVTYSGQAWPAIRQGEFIARHLWRLHTGRHVRRFRPRMPASAVPIGDAWAYWEWHGIYAKGYTGHLIRRYIEYRGYRKLLPRAAARAAWMTHDLPAADEM